MRVRGNRLAVGLLAAGLVQVKLLRAVAGDLGNLLVLGKEARSMRSIFATVSSKTPRAVRPCRYSSRRASSRGAVCFLSAVVSSSRTASAFSTESDDD